MYNHPNFLRLYRKRSMLSLADIAFLMDISNLSLISRYEKGHRTPTIEFLLTYHLLFDTTVEVLLEPHKKLIHEELPKRIKELKARLSEVNETPKLSARITFLDQVYKRLVSENHAR